MKSSFKAHGQSPALMVADMKCYLCATLEQPPFLHFHPESTTHNYIPLCYSVLLMHYKTYSNYKLLDIKQSCKANPQQFLNKPRTNQQCLPLQPIYTCRWNYWYNYFYLCLIYHLCLIKKKTKLKLHKQTPNTNNERKPFSVL